MLFQSINRSCYLIIPVLAVYNEFTILGLMVNTYVSQMQAKKLKGSFVLENQSKLSYHRNITQVYIVNFISLLAKIFNFGKYVRLTVCLFVCLSVCVCCNTGRTVRQINTKLSPHMELGCEKGPIVFLGQRSNNYVTRSKNMSHFEIAIALSIFELEYRS